MRIFLMCRLVSRGALRYETAFNTEMQRIDGNCQCPLQVCRVDGRIDAAFDERMTIEAHFLKLTWCVRACERGSMLGSISSLYLAKRMFRGDQAAGDRTGKCCTYGWGPQVAAKLGVVLHFLGEYHGNPWKS